MQFSPRLLIAFQVLLTLTDAAPTPAEVGEKFLKLDFSRVTRTKQRAANTLAARSPLVGSLVNEQEIFYQAALEIGTPPQLFTADIDTGSSDLWLYGGDGPGQYNTQHSSTYQYVDNGFSTHYGDGSEASGNWIRDTVRFAGASLPQYQFGLKLDTAEADGQFFGIGLKANEASNTVGDNGVHYQYDNFPQRLKNAKLTESASYSVFLNDSSAATGSVLFGAVDTSKFVSLATLPILNEVGYDFATQIAITLTSISLSLNGQTHPVIDVPFKIVPDTGTTAIVAPAHVLDVLAESLNLLYSDVAGWGGTQSTVDAISPDATLDFNLQGQVVKVPIASLFYASGFSITVDGQPEPYLAFLVTAQDESQDDVYYLGDAFMRYAYTVFDFDNLQVAIGQADFSGRPESIEVIGENGIPSATSASGPVWSTFGPIATVATFTQSSVPVASS